MKNELTLAFKVNEAHAQPDHGVHVILTPMPTEKGVRSQSNLSLVFPLADRDAAAVWLLAIGKLVTIRVPEPE